MTKQSRWEVLVWVLIYTTGLTVGVVIGFKGGLRSAATKEITARTEVGIDCIEKLILCSEEIGLDMSEERADLARLRE